MSRSRSNLFSKNIVESDLTHVNDSLLRPMQDLKRQIQQMLTLSVKPGVQLAEKLLEASIRDIETVLNEHAQQETNTHVEENSAPSMPFRRG